MAVAAEQAHRQAILLPPGWANVRNDYGVLLAESGRLCEAARCFRLAQRLGLNTDEVRGTVALAEAWYGEQPAEN